MISFACRCTYRFSLPDDQAGGMIQCPQCHRLVDIPTLTDLDHIDSDGSYKVEEGIIPLADPDRLSTLHRAFTRQHTDESGSEIDLRPTIEDVMKAGTEEMPYELAEEVRPAPPKYDPLTGELIRPIDVTPGEKRVSPGAVPMAQRAVEYAGADLNRSFRFLPTAMHLLQPVNLFVMAIIVLVHVILQPVNLMMNAGIFIVAPLWIIGVAFLIAHYGNVVDEIGPADRDELPRPLRDASFSDDIWRPFTQVTGALILCYWPLLFVRGSALPFTGVGLFLLGSFFYPAVLLTLATSGTALNLRPDRIIGVISRIGPRYLMLVGLFIAADIIYGIGVWRFHMDSMLLLVQKSTAQFFRSGVPWWFEPWFGYPALFAGIFLMHWFCWSLGLAYRAHHEQFPWVFQRHIPTRLRDRTQIPPNHSNRTANANSQAVKQKLNVR